MASRNWTGAAADGNVANAGNYDVLPAGGDTLAIPAGIVAPPFGSPYPTSGAYPASGLVAVQAGAAINGGTWGALMINGGAIANGVFNGTVVDAGAAAEISGGAFNSEVFLIGGAPAPTGGTFASAPLAVGNGPQAGCELIVRQGCDMAQICFGVPAGFESLGGSTPSLEFSPLLGGLPAQQPVLTITGTIQTGSIVINGQTFTTWLQFTPTAAQTATLTDLTRDGYLYRVRCYFYNDGSPPVATQTIEVVSGSPCTVTW